MSTGARIDALYQRTIQLLLVMTTLNAAFAASIDDSFLLLGRYWRFWLLAELVTVVWAYRVWRRDLAGPVRGRVAVACAAFVSLALVSALWSGHPHLTLRRAAAFGLVLAVGVGLASVTAGRPRAVARMLAALLTAAVLVAILGLLMLWVSHDLAVQPATVQYPARFRGIGQNPNTAALLLALAIPLSLWAFARSSSLGWKTAAVGSFLVLDGSIVASGSRGALVAGFAGAVTWLVALRAPARTRALLVVAAAVVFVADIAITRIPSALEAPPAQPSAAAPTPQRNVENVLPLADELGRPRGQGGTIHRTLFGTSGRGRAWSGALGQVKKRPVAGYGFGTEDRVFADRYYGFDSSLPENSYIGVLLQLGVAGGLAIVALLVFLALAAWRAVSRAPPGARGTAAACAAVLVAGLVLASTQSFLTAAGNLAAATFWIASLLACAFLSPNAAT
jgi:O-Antigen ligase